MTFDELRRKNPTLGFAAYAVEPNGPVTLEVFAFGQVGTFEGATLAHCIEKAFPSAPKPTNELTPIPAAPRPAPPLEDHPGIPDFLRREPEPDNSVFD